MIFFLDFFPRWSAWLCLSSRRPRRWRVFFICREKKWFLCVALRLLPSFSFLWSVFMSVDDRYFPENNLHEYNISYKILCRSANSSSQKRLLAVMYMHNINIKVILIRRGRTTRFWLVSFQFQYKRATRNGKTCVSSWSCCLLPPGLSIWMPIIMAIVLCSLSFFAYFFKI